MFKWLFDFIREPWGVDIRGGKVISCLRDPYAYDMQNGVLYTFRIPGDRTLEQARKEALERYKKIMESEE